MSAHAHAAFDAGAVVFGQPPLKASVHQIVKPEVADVHEGVTLVMLRLFAAHPALVRGEFRVAFRVGKISALTRGAIQLRRAPFHVVRPTAFLVAVGRGIGVTLLHAFVRPAQRIDLLAGLETLLGEGRVARVILPNLIGQRHGGGVTSGEIRQAGGFALVLPQPLRFAIRAIHHAVTAFAPAVIGKFVLRQTRPAVVPVVGDLMIQLIGRGMEFEHPVQSPARFIEQIRNAVGAGLAERVELIGERGGRRAGCRRRGGAFPGRAGEGIVPPDLIGQQHLRGGVGGGDEILELIRGVMPAAPDINVRAGGQRPISRLAVELVAVCVQPGIVTAPLLAHEIEQVIREIAVGPGADGEGQRFRRAEAQHVTPRLAERTEIEVGMVFKLSPAHAGNDLDPARQHDVPAVRLDDAKVRGQRCRGKRHRQLGRVWSVAKLVGAEENFSRRGNGDRQEKGAEHCG